MTLTERQAFLLEQEFLADDLGRSPSGEAEMTRIKRALTRALYENPGAAPQDVISWVTGALDKVVTAWEASTVVSKGQPQIVDGVRTAAAFIAAAAERAGFTMPAQPEPMPPRAPTQPDEHLVVDSWPAGPAIAGPTAPMFGGM